MGSLESPSPGARKAGVVIDASILLKLLLPEERSGAVRRLWGQWVERDTEILDYEIWTADNRLAAALRRKVSRLHVIAE